MIIIPTAGGVYIYIAIIPTTVVLFASFYKLPPVIIHYICFLYNVLLLFYIVITLLIIIVTLKNNCSRQDKRNCPIHASVTSVNYDLLSLQLLSCYIPFRQVWHSNSRPKSHFFPSCSKSTNRSKVTGARC